MIKKTFIEDEEDKAMIKAYERGEFVPVRGQKKTLALARRAAVDFREKKEARINIRLPENDLRGLKAKAAEEGMPYQTLISSILHKFVSGRLINRRA